ncbi:MAG: hypothetical protein HZB56_08855 [Deltaproteobacteria bacterium]|nr:hypothetical protein [Deltaproteobacteria bacterium]
MRTIAAIAAALLLPLGAHAEPVADAVAAGVPAAVARQVAERAEGRGVPAALVLAPVADAARLGVPGELVADKVLEGLAKGVPGERIAAVARGLGERLAEAERILRAARQAGLPAPAERRAALTDLAQSLQAGAPRPALDDLLSAARAARTGSDAVVAAAHSLGELARRGVPPADALPLARALAGSRGPAGDPVAVFDAWRAEGGRDVAGFLSEATRRVESGRKLDGMVDYFGESADKLQRSRSEERGERGADPEKGKGLSPAERPDAARGAVPGLDDAARGRKGGKPPRGRP